MDKLPGFVVREGQVTMEGYTYDGIGVYCSTPSGPVILVVPGTENIDEFYKCLTGSDRPASSVILPMTMSSPMLTRVDGWRWHTGRSMWIKTVSADVPWKE